MGGPGGGVSRGSLLASANARMSSAVRESAPPSPGGGRKERVELIRREGSRASRSSSSTEELWVLPIRARDWKAPRSGFTRGFVLDYPQNEQSIPAAKTPRAAGPRPSRPARAEEISEQSSGRRRGQNRQEPGKKQGRKEKYTPLRWLDVGWKGTRPKVAGWKVLPQARRSRWRDPDLNRGHHDFQSGA